MYAHDLLDGLNDEQRAVAQFDEPAALRVLAGAGTGKTTALTARVARIVADGTPAERVLLLTFTRRAARQMIDRSHTRLAHAGLRSGRVSGGTFHSVAHRTLRQHAARLGLPEGFSVLDPSDAADVMDVVRDETVKSLPNGRRFPRKSTLLDLYSRAVDTGTPVGEVINAVAPWASDLAEPIGTVCKAYIARKRRLGLLDFDDLLLHWRQALRDDLVGRSLGGLYDHVLVDEYQDVNALQVEVLQLLRTHDPRLTVVGDDAQAIYSFRASDPKHILDFGLDFPASATLRLGTNYRSTQSILDTANALADDAPAGFSTRLHAAEAGPDHKPRLVRCADEDHQSALVCEQILEHREQGTALREQAVLVRAAHHSDHLEIELGRRGIPFVKYGGCDIWRPPTSKTCSRRSGSPTTRATRWRGSASCSCCPGSDPRRPNVRSQHSVCWPTARTPTCSFGGRSPWPSCPRPHMHRRKPWPGRSGPNRQSRCARPSHR